MVRLQRRMKAAIDWSQFKLLFVLLLFRHIVRYIVGTGDFFIDTFFNRRPILHCVNGSACFIKKVADESATGASCDDAFVVNSTCYKNHKRQARWFTAVNRCLANNATLAVFDDDVRQYFPGVLVQSSNAWIGLVKSWWTWPGLERMP